METLSAYARQFIGNMEKPDVDKIDGLSPSISIEQKTISQNPRSTVGTVTEIYDFLRLLYARCGTQYSPDSGLAVTRQTTEQMLDIILSYKQGMKLIILAPVVKGRKGHYKELFKDISSDGFSKVRVDGEVLEITPGMTVSRYKVHDIEIVIDRISVDKRSKSRIKDSLSVALKYGEGVVIVNDGKKDTLFNERYSDPVTGRSFSELNPNSFSFNSQYGWCSACQGLGIKKEMDSDKIFPNRNLSFKEGGIAPVGLPSRNWLSFVMRGVLNELKVSEDLQLKKYSEENISYILKGIYDRKINMKIEASGNAYDYKYNYTGLIKYLEKIINESESVRQREWAESFVTFKKCDVCKGGRLKEDALWVKIQDKNINDLSLMSISELSNYFRELNFDDRKQVIAEKIIKEIRTRLDFLLNVGLDYLTLDRTARTLSGGEAQRIRLATQIGSQLTGVLYILDEPSIGLHQRDNIKLISSLKHLRDLGNSVIVVEHDREMIESSDYIVDLGPGAGEHGGEVVAAGRLQDMDGNSITVDYIRGKKDILYRKERREGTGESLILKGAGGNNLKNITLKIPLGKFICVTGVSGSGKSTLINDNLYRILMKELNGSTEIPLPYKSISSCSGAGKPVISTCSH